jgi:hypothetical protein
MTTTASTTTDSTTMTSEGTVFHFVFYPLFAEVSNDANPEVHER